MVLTSPQIVVIGAGPAGLMAAGVAARCGAQVTVIERMPSPARKFLMAGRGGLNLTHTDPLPQFLEHYGSAASWLAPALEHLPPDALRGWADAHGETTFAGSSGRVFPRSFKASPLLRAWLRELDRLGVTLLTRRQWTGWTPNGDLAFADGSTIAADATVLAMGGASWPRLGADGNWVGILQAQGIEVRRLRASNAGVLIGWSQLTIDRHAGQPLKRIALSLAGHSVAGEAMITTRGLEGGAVYALSRQLRAGLDDHPGHGVTLMLDLKPDQDAVALAARLAAVPRKQSLANRLRKGTGLSAAAISVWRDFTPKLPGTDEALAASLKAVALPVTGLQPLDRAISSAGGIAMGELDDAFMLRKLPAVFACGEMLDWDAPTGGYLLQACFSTGAMAGRGAVQFAGAGEREL